VFDSLSIQNTFPSVQKLMTHMAGSLLDPKSRDQLLGIHYSPQSTKYLPNKNVNDPDESF